MQSPSTPPPQVASTAAVAAAAFTAEAHGLTLGTFASVKGLEAVVDVLEYREGGINDVVYRLPGQVTYPNLVLSNGLTSSAVEDWFRKTLLGADRRTVTVTFLDADGEVVRAWAFAEAYPIRWTGPVLSAGGTDIAGEELEIAHAGMTVMAT
ncbi:MAG TPA: phage tail protein [Solirubrobacteraceae bacterium]|jgi:phage tail-like protein|nr:phage tail protein [Solirubrobacteraceae bacterium]